MGGKEERKEGCCHSAASTDGGCCSSTHVSLVASSLEHAAQSLIAHNSTEGLRARDGGGFGVLSQKESE